MDFPSCSSLLAAWTHRAAVKQFDPSRPVSQGDWDFVRESLALVPSAYGLQPYRLIEVRGAQVRAKLRAAAFDQRQVTDADRLLVFAVMNDFGETELEDHLERLRTQRGLPEEALGIFRNKVNDRVLHALSPVQRRAWQARQAYIALGSLLWATSLRGLDTCPIEALDIPAWDGLLDLEWKGLTCVCACAVGYRSAEESYADQPKVRVPLDEFLLVHEA